MPDAQQPPAARGFRMPAEFEPHAATWLAWPHKQESWPGNFAPIPGVWVEMVRALAPHERVNILVNDPDTAAAVDALLRHHHVGRENVGLHCIPTDDAWARDHGPTFITRTRDGSAELAAIDWIYNAWGGKYPPWEHDDVVPQQIGALLGIAVSQPGIV